MITEATFALPIYRWPSPSAVAEQILQWWRVNADQHRASLLLCYSLGKAQRVLAELDPMDTLAERILQPDPYRPSSWNPERLFTALFPAVCWSVAWGFWILTDPPGGPAIPMIAAALGLSAVMAPINLTGLLIVLLLSMFITVAPVYMFLMPTLDSGAALLGLVFTYTFVFGFLGGKSPVLKIGPLMMFVMVVNITNEQVYSFMAMVAFSLVLLLGPL